MWSWQIKNEIWYEAEYISHVQNEKSVAVFIAKRPNIPDLDKQYVIVSTDKNSNITTEY